MRIDAIYDHGRLEFTLPLQLKHGRVRIVVEVPDDEIVDTNDSSIMSPDLRRQARAMLTRFEAIRNAPPLGDPPELTQKQLERIEAFEMRAQYRIEQGRTD